MVSCSVCVFGLWYQQVRRGRFKNEIDVAVKTMKDGSMQEADFIDEAKTMMCVEQFILLTQLYAIFIVCLCIRCFRTGLIVGKGIRDVNVLLLILKHHET